MRDTEVVIIGAGLAGLSCALHLAKAGVTFELFEASDEVGGRVRTDLIDGFRLDRGFQVLLTAYPEARAVCDYHTLKLARFYEGVRIRLNGRFHLFPDPLRHPRELIRIVRSPLATLQDKVKIAALRARLAFDSDEAIFRRSSSTTARYLEHEGFSELVQHTVFWPLFRGMLLDRKLETSSRLFEFLFKMLAEGPIAVPRLGMQEIPRQLAAQLPAGHLHLGRRVHAVHGRTAVFEDGSTVHGRVVVCATDQRSAAQLTEGVVQFEPQAWKGCTSVYFSAPRAPIRGPFLLLNGEQDGMVNTVCVMSEISPSLSPEGRALIVANVPWIPEESEDRIDQTLRSELRAWFGDQIESWRLLRSYRIPQALPYTAEMGAGFRSVTPTLLLCGDYLDSSTINGALRSGRKAADEVLRRIGRAPHR